MDAYQLTGKGRALAHSVRAPRTPSWSVIYFLSKHRMATKEQLLEYVPGATIGTIIRLKSKGVIMDGQ